MAPKKPKEAESLEIVPAEVTPVNLLAVMKDEAAKRQMVTKYITHHMKEGTDYGKIHIAKDCPNKYRCTNDYHFSKPSLFKPGGEKFASLFKLRSAWRKDAETWEMLGSEAGMICYVCELFTSKGQLVGEGRGAASVKEKGNANTAIKIAKKRAFIDAILSTGALSDFFTQDLEDMKLDDTGEKSAPAEKVVSYGGDDIDDTPPPPPPSKPPQSPLKSEIAKQLVTLGFNIKNSTRAKADELVKSLTGLEMKEENYEEIHSRLGVKIIEKQD